MHLVYYAIGVSIVNAWLVYRRHSSQNCTTKKDTLQLKEFQCKIAISLIQKGKTPARGRGRPSKSQLLIKPRTSASVAIPTPDIRYDNVGHLPLFVEKQGRCRYCPKGFSFLVCSKCKIRLCLFKDRNCFLQFHST